MEIYEINAIFMPANTISILHPMDQRVILNFKSNYLRNIFHVGIAATNRGSSDGSGQSKLRPSGKDPSF